MQASDEYLSLDSNCMATCIYKLTHSRVTPDLGFLLEREGEREGGR